MSKCCWRSAVPLQVRRREQIALQRADARARLRRTREQEEWKVTGEHAFQPKERQYPNGGGVDGVAAFLGSTERAIHLYDRGKVLTGEMSAAISSLERRQAAVIKACDEFGDKHAPHLHPDRCRDWIVGAQELRLFVDAAERMTPKERKAFINVLAPFKDKSKQHIGPLEPLAARLQRAKNASIQQAVSGVIFGAGEAQSSSVHGNHGGGGRFARSVRVASRKLPNN